MGSPLLLRLRTAGLSGGGGGGGGGGAIGETIPASYFGMHIGRLAPTTIWGDYSPAATAAYVQVPYPSTLGIGLVRLWDSDGCSWRNIERSRGNYTWDRLDNAINICVANGAQVMYTLGCGPDWATTSPGQYAGLYVGYNPYPPSDMTYWTEWCTAVATRYAGKGIIYEIWNEVNDQAAGAGYVGSGFVGSIATLIQLAQIAYSVIKAIDPTARIATPNFVGQDSLVGQYATTVAFDNYLAAGGANYADIVAMHGYNTLAPWKWPEGVVEMGTRCKQIMKAANVTLPLWNTEWGFGRWVDSSGADQTWPVAMPDQHGADYITRMVLLNWVAGFRTFCFYGFDANTSYATIKMIDPPSPSTLLLPSYAYQFLRNLLVGGAVSGFQSIADPTGKPYYKVNVTTGDGRIGSVYWTPQYATASIAVPAGATILDNLGNTVANTGTLTLTKSPQFVLR